MTGRSITKGRVSVVILNWNKPHDTVECIRSIKTQTYTDHEIIVVDNGSVDNSIEILEQIKNITLIKNPSNRGFTGGHIDGLRHASGEYIFVLNNDAVVDPSYIEKAIDTMNSRENIAVVGGRAYLWQNDDDKFKTDIPYYAFQTINPVTAEGIFVASDNHFPHRTNWVSGSAMMIRREVLDKVGYFYNPLFAYYEESDLFARMAINGYDIVYSPELHIWHKMGASSSTYFQNVQLFKNRVAFATRSFTGLEYARFIKSYSVSSLKDIAVHTRNIRKLTKEERLLVKARASALMSAVTQTPRWLMSSRGIKKLNTIGESFTSRIHKQNLGISFIYNSSDLDINDKAVIESIKTACFYYYLSEFIIVCPSSEVYLRHKSFISSNLRGYPVYLVLDKGQSQANPLNLGWLSASKDYVSFGQRNIPTPSTIDKNLNLATKTKSLFAKDKENTLVSRDLLALYGGLIFDDLENSLMALGDFADHHKPALTIRKETPLPGNLLETIKKRRFEALNQYHEGKKRKSVWSRITQRHYRLYQLSNLILFTLSPKIPLRLKAGRIKNTLTNVAKLNKKDLATELKHMSNDVVKRLRPNYDADERLSELRFKSDAGIKNWKQAPVFIICRDRLSTLEQLLSWLESAGMNNIFLIDNDSAFPDLVKHLQASPYQVIFTRKNIGHTVPWTEGIVKALCYGEYYIVSDPDVIPDSECPDSAIQHFFEIHKKYINYAKVGFGLKIDDLPDHYPLKESVIKWEKQFWQQPLEENIYEAGVDTTFALYKPYTHNYTLHPSIRVGRPYVASHLPWYTDGSKLDEEEAYYRARASQDITSWNSNEVLDRYKKALSR